MSYVITLPVGRTQGIGLGVLVLDLKRIVRGSGNRDKKKSKRGNGIVTA